MDEFTSTCDELLKAFLGLEDIALRARSRYGRPSLGQATEAYLQWMEAKRAAGRDGLEELKRMGHDYEEVEARVAKFIERMRQIYAECGIRPSDPNADKLYELATSGYPILAGAASKGYPLTAEGIARYIEEGMDGLDNKWLEDLVRELPPKSSAITLAASRVRLGLEEAEMKLRELREMVRVYLKMVLEGDEATEAHKDIVMRVYGKYCLAMKVAGRPPKGIEQLVGEWFGGYCAGLFRGDPEVSGDAEFASKLYRLYNAAHDAHLQLLYNKAESKRARLKARAEALIKALKKFVVENLDRVEEVKQRYGAVITWIYNLEELISNVEYDPNAPAMEELEERGRQTSLTSFL